MAYQIECVVKEVRLDDKDLLFTFEPISKYQVEFGGEKIFIAADAGAKSVVSVPECKLKKKMLSSATNTEMLKIMCATGKPVVLTVEASISDIKINGLS